MSIDQDPYCLGVAVPRPLDTTYTYRIPDDWVANVRRGSWVKVPFGRGQTHGFVIDDPRRFSSLSLDFEVDQLKSVVEMGALGTEVPEEVFELCLWAKKYYQAPLGEVLASAVPAAALGLKSRVREARKIELDAKSTERSIIYTEEQSKAIEELSPYLSGAKPQTALLHGITGSGKTEVYLALARKVLSNGRSVLFLVPEIALTPQLHERIENGMGCAVGLWHSAIPDGQRRDLWSALIKGELRALVGARSAVFAPLQNLGLIVVDEEHDGSYKQEDRFRYHARDLAVVRSVRSNALAVLGSATPSLETLEKVRLGKYQCSRLMNRVKGGVLPEVKIVDLAEEERVEGIQTPLLKSTVSKINEVIDSGHQVMVFLNRRGFASFLLCTDCSSVIECPNCSVTLTLHKRAHQLKCHLCGHRESLPDQCEKCSGRELIPMGSGTESLEQDLKALVPNVRPLRLDRDQITSTGRLERVLNEFRDGKSNLLLGTQMLVKGHDFPNVTLVVVVLADGLFRFPDFRAPERAYQILTQVAGRAGRGESAGEVWMQAFATDHPVLRAVRGEISEADFLNSERELRGELGYPPFGRLVRLRVEHQEAMTAKKRAMELSVALRDGGLKADTAADLLGPSEAFVERLKGKFRWDILIKSKSVAELQRLVQMAKRFTCARRWSLVVDVDPQS